MNRAEMVEKAARASYQQGRLCAEYVQWDELRESVRREYRENAAAVLDAILPQVTTVEELEALPVGTIVVDNEDEAQTKLPDGWWRNPSGGDLLAEQVVLYGPLTVVRQP